MVGSAGVTPVSGSGSVGRHHIRWRLRSAAAEAAAEAPTRAIVMVGAASYSETAAGTRFERNASRSARMAAAVGYRRSGWYASSLLMMAARAGGHESGSGSRRSFVLMACSRRRLFFSCWAYRPVPGHHLVEHHAERPEVDVRIHATRLELLGRGVANRAPDIGGDLAGLGEGLRNAEVEHADLARARQQDVLRLQVGVHDCIAGLALDGQELVRLVEELADTERRIWPPPPAPSARRR